MNPLPYLSNLFARSHMLITYQCAAQNYLIDSVINTLTTLLRWGFVLHVFKGKSLWKIQCGELSNFPFLLNEEKIVF